MMKFNYIKEREAKKMFKKSWALLLTVAMLLSCIAPLTAMAASFNSFELKYEFHGSTDMFRFVTKGSDLPSDPTVIVGADVTGTLEHSGGSIPFKSTVAKVEDRGDGNYTVSVPETDTVKLTEWPNEDASVPKHTWKLTISPAGTGNTPVVSTPDTQAPATSGNAGSSVNGLAFTDIAESPYKDEISLLNAISVLAGDPAGTFRPNDTISRAEMAAIIVRIYGLESTVIATETKFDDVPSSHWASGYVDVASGLGVINGDGDGKFRPDDKVTYNEAVKMLVCVVGYGLEATERGGWPSGYLVVANDLDIDEDVLNTSGEASRETVAKLVANTLDVEYLEKSGFGDKQEWVAIKGRTLLSEKLLITKVEDTVTESKIASLVGEGTLKDGEVRIGNTKYLAGETDIDMYVGYPVIAYAKYDKSISKDDKVIVHFMIDEEDTDFIEIAAEDVAGAGSKYIEIFEDETKSDKKVRYTVDQNTYIFVNGLGAMGYDLSVLAPVANKPSFDGKVIIIDIDEDEVIDTIFVEKVETYLVGRLNRTNKGFYITCKTPVVGPAQQIPSKSGFDLTDKDVKVSITKDGKEISYTDIQEYDIVHYSGSGNVHNLVVSSERVEGTVAETTSDGEVIMENGEVYEYAPVTNYISDAMKSKCTAGSGVTLFLDAYGKIAYMEVTSSTADTYGYLMGLAEEETFDGNTIFARVINTSTGAFDELEISDKRFEIITHKTVGSGDDTKVEDIISEYTSKSPVTIADFEDHGLADASGVIPQLIKYSANANNQIVSIELALKLDGTKPKDYKNAQLAVFNGNQFYADGTNVYVNTGKLNTSKDENMQTTGYFTFKGQKFLFLPTSGGKIIEEDVQVTTPDSLVNSNYTPLNGGSFTLYDVAKDGTPGLIVGTIAVDGTGAEETRANFMTITKVAESKDANGQKAYKITGMSGVHRAALAETSITLTSDVAYGVYPGGTKKSPAQLRAGDVIAYKQMPNGKIYKYNLIFSMDNALKDGYKGLYVAAENNFTDEFGSGEFSRKIQGVLAGYAYDRFINDDTDFIHVKHEDYTTEANGDMMDGINLSEIKLFLRYDASKGSVETMDVTDLPYPEEVDADEPGAIQVDDKYYKAPLIVCQTYNDGGTFRIKSLMYVDTGMFD